MQQPGRDIRQWQLLVAGIECHCRARHTPYHGTGLILGYGVCSRLTHFQQAGRTVFTHARENHPYRRLSGNLGNAVEQHVHRGFMAVDGFCVQQSGVDMCTATFNNQVRMARCQIGNALSQFFPALSLYHFHSGVLVEAAGK